MTNSKPLSPELLSEVYSLCFNYAVKVLGKKNSGELLRASYRTILPYFHSLENFSPDADGELQIHKPEISEKDLLAFTIWIHQFIRELKKMVVGMGKFDIRRLTEKIGGELEQTGFYEYYQQAQELKYET